jgi:hypothetical protein
MWDIAGEVVRAVRVTKATGRLVRSEGVSDLWKEVYAVFGDASMRWPLWDHLRAGEGLHVVRGWHLASEFLDGAPALLLFEPKDEMSYFVFDVATDIVSVIDECYGFEFYITNPLQSYLLAFNHHDFLIGAGLAREWILKVRERGPIVVDGSDLKR